MPRNPITSLNFLRYIRASIRVKDIIKYFRYIACACRYYIYGDVAKKIKSSKYLLTDLKRAHQTAFCHCAAATKHILFFKHAFIFFKCALRTFLLPHHLKKHKIATLYIYTHLYAVYNLIVIYAIMIAQMRIKLY